MDEGETWIIGTEESMAVAHSVPTRDTVAAGTPAAIRDDPPETNAHGDPQARQAAALLRKGRR